MAVPVTVGLLVRIEALPGRESDVENFLQQGLGLVEQEPNTVRWFAIRFGPSSFGIYDAFPSGRVAGAETDLPPRGKPGRVSSCSGVSACPGRQVGDCQR